MKNILRASIVVLAVFAFQVHTLAQTEETRTLSDDDKAVIIKLAIELRLLGEQRSTSEDGRTFPVYKSLSTKGISSDLVSKLADLKVAVQRPQQVLKLSRQSRGIRYLEVRDFTWEADKLRFSLVAIYRGMGQFITGHSYRYVFEKVAGKWQGKLVLVIC
jgi:hypothetical protein